MELWYIEYKIKTPVSQVKFIIGTKNVTPNRFNLNYVSLL